MKKWLAVSMIVISSLAMANQELTEEQLQAWFDSDEMELPTATIDVNEGELVFLVERPEKPALHSTNKFVINENSLESGWLNVFQCFKNLDGMAESEIVYRNNELRSLKIDLTENIEKAFVSGSSVQLKNVTRPARLCVSAEVKNLHTDSEGRFVLKNGPYHRRFLDGYYPFELTMDIRLPQGLKLVQSKPHQQNGFEVNVQDQRVLVNTLFEGRLFTELTFVKVDQ